MRLRLLTLLLLCFGYIWPAFAPSSRATSATVVISEFRTRGPNGGNDEFIELYNLSELPSNVSNWQIKGSNAAGTTSVRAIIPNGTLIAPHCHYLITNSNPTGGPYSGSVPGDQTYGVGITDDGGIALTTADGTIVDQVGMSSGSAYREGSTIDALTTSANRSYERRPGGSAGSSQDTDNNRSDFRLISPSSPQSAGSSCITFEAPSDPVGLGNAAPSSVVAGGMTFLTVSVSPGSNPVSTGITVTGDLSAIGGSSAQRFFDDGTNGDATSGDSIFSFVASIGAAVTPGTKSLNTTIADFQGRSSSTLITLAVGAIEGADCGVERWPVKIGSDPGATLISLSTVSPITIRQLTAFATPNTLPPSARATSAEQSVYAVTGMLTDYKLEDDSDYHLVIRDRGGRSMIVEIPCSCCIPPASPFLAKIESARQMFDAHFTASNTFQTTNVPVVITGVGFFDFIHGQRGVAPNGIELHPVLDISFDTDLNTPVIVSVTAAGKKLFISGLNFDEGAVLLLNGEKQKTRNDEEGPETSLICKKAGKNVAPGEAAILQVRNSDGSLSAQFQFSRPSE